MSPRPRCSGCERLLASCLCHALRPEASEVVVGVLQHPREARVSKSTGTLIPLALSNAFRLVGVGLDRDGRIEGALAPWGPGQVGLLFPLDASPIAEAPAGLGCVLVLDGSWAQARAILRATPSLQGLPRFALPAGLQGGYAIRKPQGPGRLSTLEAAVAALRILEGEPGAYQAALDLQAALVERWRERLRAGSARHPAIGTARWGGRGKPEEGV
jgi:DTW domain-containing protein YfiP